MTLYLIKLLHTCTITSKSTLRTLLIRKGTHSLPLTGHAIKKGDDNNLLAVDVQVLPQVLLPFKALRVEQPLHQIGHRRDVVGLQCLRRHHSQWDSRLLNCTSSQANNQSHIIYQDPGRLTFAPMFLK